MQGECIHYFYVKKGMPNEESPGITMTLDKNQHQTISASISNAESNISQTTLDKNSFNLKLQGVVSIAIWLQGQRAVTSFLPLDNQWTALIRIFLGTIENISNDFPGVFYFHRCSKLFMSVRFRLDKDSFMEHQLGLAIAVTMFLKQDEYHSKLI